MNNQGNRQGIHGSAPVAELAQKVLTFEICY